MTSVFFSVCLGYFLNNHLGIVTAVSSLCIPRFVRHSCIIWTVPTSAG